jgi:hypothetical protein
MRMGGVLNRCNSQKAARATAPSTTD